MSRVRWIAAAYCHRTGTLVGNASAAAPGTTYPNPVEGDYVIKNFTFTSGETLPELRIHYHTLGKPSKDAKGMVRNAVLIGHGTGGSGDGFLRPQFAGELFGPGQLAGCLRNTSS